MRSGLRAKILIAFLLLSLIPLCLTALFIFLNATRMQTSIVSRTTESLDARMERKMQRRATEVASSVRNLLLQAGTDHHSLVLVTRTEQAYFRFAQAHRGDIWERKGSRDRSPDTVFMLPIYRKVFEPFFTTKREGTGLGLYITHQIIADHGGDVFISENSGGGPVFSVFLPRNGRRHKYQRTGTGQV